MIQRTGYILFVILLILNACKTKEPDRAHHTDNVATEEVPTFQATEDSVISNEIANTILTRSSVYYQKDTLRAITIHSKTIKISLDTMLPPDVRITDTLVNSTLYEFHYIDSATYSTLFQRRWKDPNLVTDINQVEFLTKTDSCYLLKLKDGRETRMFCSEAVVYDDQTVVYQGKFIFYHKKKNALLFSQDINEGYDVYLTFLDPEKTFLIWGIPKFSPSGNRVVSAREDWGYMNNVFEVYAADNENNLLQHINYCCQWSASEYFWLDNNHLIFKVRDGRGNRGYVLMIARDSR